MIRNLSVEDINEVNFLLSNFSYSMSEESLNNVFLKSLVYDDGGIKGIVLYDFLYDRIEIEYIIVDNNYRRRGIATKLLKEVEKENIKNITLEVRESNITAINFYKKNGFKIEAVRKNYYGNENGYLMLKELGE